MNVNPGTYNLGPSDGTVRVKTGRQGMASKVKDEVEVNLDVALPVASA
jgi:hypothetical protein